MHTFFTVSDNFQFTITFDRLTECFFIQSMYESQSIDKTERKVGKMLTKLFFPSVFEFHKSNRKLFTGITYIL